MDISQLAGSACQLRCHRPFSLSSASIHAIWICGNSARANAPSDSPSCAEAAKEDNGSDSQSALRAPPVETYSDRLNRG
jgi:hypothetical protein